MRCVQAQQSAGGLLASGPQKMLQRQKMLKGKGQACWRTSRGAEKLKGCRPARVRDGLRALARRQGWRWASLLGGSRLPRGFL